MITNWKMGAAPSREAHERVIAELCEKGSNCPDGSRRKKELTLLPLTKSLMHYVPSATPRKKRSTSQVHAEVNNNSNTSNVDSGLAQCCLDANPADLPFIQQLYSVYKEPCTQFYCRKESWGTMDSLPSELYYPTIEAFYEATVGSYEKELFNTDEEMQQVWEQEMLMAELASAKGRGTTSKNGKKALPRMSRIRPLPCAIGFMYPTSAVAPQSKSKKTKLPRKGEDASSAALRSGAPHGSVVFAPYCSFMVIGFVGLVPVRRAADSHSSKATGDTFMRPPVDDAGDVGESQTEEEKAAVMDWELISFISKSAGEQHLCRVLFQASLMYVEQCRRAGLAGNPPLPPLRYSCLLTDVPSLCYLREVRLRCAEARWTTEVATALRDIRVASQHIVVRMTDTAAAQVCSFMAESYIRMTFRAPPTVPPYFFGGFVAAEPNSTEDGAVSPFASWALPSLPTDGPGSPMEALVQDYLQNWRPATSSAAAATTAEGQTIAVQFIVGGNGYTMGKTYFRNGTVLQQEVDTKTFAFQQATWTVAIDDSGSEPLPIDAPCDGSDSVLGEAEAGRPPLLPSDVILSWAKDLYLHARITEADDAKWVRGYPLSYYLTPAPALAPAPLSHGAAKANSARPSTFSAAPTGLYTESSAAEEAEAEAESDSFYIWRFEHQGKSYSIGIVPNFVRAQQKQDTYRTAGINTVNATPDAKKKSSGGSAALYVCSGDAPLTPSRPISVFRSPSSQSSCGGSALSEDTYHTNASSHSTLSNLPLRHLHRTPRQRHGAESQWLGAPSPSAQGFTRVMGSNRSSRGFFSDCSGVNTSRHSFASSDYDQGSYALDTPAPVGSGHMDAPPSYLYPMESVASGSCSTHLPHVLEIDEAPGAEDHSYIGPFARERWQPPSHIRITSTTPNAVVPAPYHGAALRQQQQQELRTPLQRRLSGGISQRSSRFLFEGDNSGAASTFQGDYGMEYPGDSLGAAPPDYIPALSLQRESKSSSMARAPQQVKEQGTGRHAVIIRRAELTPTTEQSTSSVAGTEVKTFFQDSDGSVRYRWNSYATPTTAIQK